MDAAIQPGTGAGAADTEWNGERGAGMQGSADSATGRSQRRGRQSGMREREGLTNALGWFSIGLGLAQIAAPRSAARMIGIRDDARNSNLLRAIGMREIASGVGILTQSRPTNFVRSRVAGDVMDLALLGSALTSENTQRNRAAVATAAVLGITALDVRCSERLMQAPGALGRGAIHVTKSVTVDRPPDEVYRFWHDFENFPRFMRHLESVQVTGDLRSHWKAKGPAGTSLEWDAEVTDDRPNELIAWRSVENADVTNAGTVEFRPAPGGRGTEVTVDLVYDPPGGKLSANLAKLFRKEPGQEVHDDLRAFKQVMETGEVLLSDATVYPGPHPAYPPEQPVTPEEAVAM